MRKGKYYFTSESVTEGHPDKIADQISDAILDDLLKQDPSSRVAVETMVSTGMVIVAGEIRTKGYSHLPKIVRGELKKIGYTDAEYGFDYKACSVMSAIDEQSSDIALGVDTGGAGDQGMMMGFACKETPELMPLPISLAHKLTKKLASVRKRGVLKYLRPDGKSQVTVEYDGYKPVRVDTVVISCQHGPSVSRARIERDVLKHVIKPVLGKYFDTKTKVMVNPTGKFIIGGPPGDCGLTGRKIIVDTYGGYSRHGGGCFSGKDPTKVDRSGAYMARYVAKNIVAAGLASRVELQVSYAIGVKDPVSLFIDTFGTATVPGSSDIGDAEARILDAVKKVFDFTPAGIIRTLKLRRPIYSKTACYGHFGRSGEEFTWEKTSKAQKLKKLV
ncbi:methionine adenosyltransferase [Candidatus Peregrinibacteria bacterium]|jgi:S-adenosylmethionine synthetase|nr:methionine adenosyltransferase [Candidatus Peregrinibacteria bacterium]MBT4148662.1 methionine adenosyltransferase [Candidatus Peregrinibacteria bacterium]MBT4366332.1 methionine adenosyltransferase [Candidatus Peregrinibacteria bacterium]MBT4456007.1 methionine adenosyltransferase [Candidatus Peregrinibacteria bacterium]